MRQSIFAKNAPIDEKRISFIETVVGRLLRRSVKKISAMITPYPISNCVIGEDVRGVVLKYMFAARGTINKGLVRFNAGVKSGTKITISIENDIDGSAKTYIANRNQMLIEPNIEIFSGDRLTVFVDPVDESEKLTEVWVSFVWTPNMGEVSIKSFLIEELEKIEIPEE